MHLRAGFEPFRVGSAACGPSECKVDAFLKILRNWRLTKMLKSGAIEHKKWQSLIRAEIFALPGLTFHVSTTPGSSLLSSARTLLKLTRSLARCSIESTI